MPSPLHGMMLGASSSLVVKVLSLPYPSCVPYLRAGTLALSGSFFPSMEGGLRVPVGMALAALSGAFFTPAHGTSWHLGLGPAVGFLPPQPGGSQGSLGVSSQRGDLGPVFQCSSCSQQFMQKKDLQSHLIKLHGAPKPHAVSAGPAGHWELAVARGGQSQAGYSGFCLWRTGSPSLPSAQSCSVCRIVSHLCQVLPVPDGTAAARGFQAPWGEAVRV